MKYLVVYAIALVVFLAIDLLWLGVVAKNFYFSRMGDLMLPQPRWGVALAFYALFVVGLIYFAISAAINGAPWSSAILNGALFGFFCYLTYDGTNLSVLKGYDPVLAVVDVAWGTALSAVTTGITLWTYDLLGRPGS